MDNNLFTQIKDLIEKNQAIGIILPSSPSFDTAAAGLGLYLSLVQMKKNASILCPTDVTVGVSSLVGVDKIQKSFGGGGNGDLVVSFPYKEGEIEKVSYNVVGNQLQIVVKAGPQGLSFRQSDVTFVQNGGGMGGGVPSLLFFIGVADMQALGFTKQPGLTVVNIDNRSQNTKYGDVVHVDSRFTSISEEVADFLTLLEPQIELDKDTSQNLLSGILAATNDFQDGQGSYLAFEMAGILMKKGAVRSGATQPMPPLPASNYFPPQPAASQPVQNPVTVQSEFNPAPQPFAAVQGQIPTQQPMQQPFPQTAPTPVAQPQQQPQSFGNAQDASQAPADWLTPKVYKGSTVL